jgi:hypothetical protein
VRARRDRTVARVALFVPWLLCAAFPPVAAAAVPSWHGERLLPQAVGSGARVAITSAGDVAVAWQDAGKGLSVALRPAGGRFGSPQRLSRSGRWVESPESLDLVADSRGTFVVVWGDAECCHVPGDRRVWASTRGAGGPFSNPVAVSESIHEVGSVLAPAVAVGEGGSLTVVWSSDTRLPAGLAGAVIEAADRLPGGGFGPPARLSPPEGRAYQPRVAGGPSGETVVLWSSEVCPPFPCNIELEAATRPPGGGFGAPELVAVPDQSGYTSKGLTAGQVQIASDGTVVALWTESDRGMYSYGADVKAAQRPPGVSGFGSAQTLGHLGGSGPWLALDADDRAFALWGDSNTDRDHVDLHPRVFGALALPHAAFARGRQLERGGDAIGIAPGGGGAIAAWTRNEKVMAAVHRQGGYCRQPISRRPAQSDGDVAANRRGDAVAVWRGPARTRHPSKLMVAMGPADGRSPVIKHLSVRDFGAPGLSNAVRPRFRFVLSEAAEVRISIARHAGGRFRPVTSLVRSRPAGANHLTYGGRAGGLRPGRYRARISARDCGGRRSRSQAVPFVVSD